MIAFTAITAMLSLPGDSFGMDVKGQTWDSHKEVWRPNESASVVPSVYKHMNIADQLKNYRDIYDRALKKYDGNVEAIKSQPIDGLFDVLKNAFALVYNCINDKYPNNKTFQESKDLDIAELRNIVINARKKDKTPYIEALKTLWTKASQQKESMTSAAFQGFNKSLARIASFYMENEIYLPMEMEADRTNNVNDVVFVVYALPNPGNSRNISENRFVEQFFQGNYPAYIASFDILSHHGVKTKKDPHISIFNGTYRLLNHDLAYHVKFQTHISNDCKKYLKLINEIQKSYPQDSNDSKILRNGLFMLIHEMFEELVDKERKNIDYTNLQTFTDSLVNLSQKYIENLLKTYGSENYNIEATDWESILMGVDDADGKIMDKEKYLNQKNIFVPQVKSMTPFMLMMRNKQQSINRDSPQWMLSNGYNRFWNKFKELVKKGVVEQKILSPETAVPLSLDKRIDLVLGKIGLDIGGDYDAALVYSGLMGLKEILEYSKFEIARKTYIALKANIQKYAKNNDEIIPLMKEIDQHIVDNLLAKINDFRENSPALEGIDDIKFYLQFMGIYIGMNDWLSVKNAYKRLGDNMSAFVERYMSDIQARDSLIKILELRTLIESEIGAHI